MLIQPTSFGELRAALDGTQIEEDDIARLLTTQVPTFQLPRRLGGRLEAEETTETDESFVMGNLGEQAPDSLFFRDFLVRLRPGLWSLSMQIQVSTTEGGQSTQRVEAEIHDEDTSLGNFLIAIAPANATSGVTTNSVANWVILIDRVMRIAFFGGATGAFQRYDWGWSLQGSKLL